MIREALKHGCYELQKARDAWRVAVGPDGMDADLAQHYIEVCSMERGHTLNAHTLYSLPLTQLHDMQAAKSCNALLRWHLCRQTTMSVSSRSWQ